MNLRTRSQERYAILVTGPAAQQLDASACATRARILDDLSTLAEAAAQVEPPLPRSWSSELCLSEGRVFWRVEVDHLAHRVRLVEVRQPWPGPRHRPAQPV
jgi:hypothetical protein